MDRPLSSLAQRDAPQFGEEARVGQVGPGLPGGVEGGGLRLLPAAFAERAEHLSKAGAGGPP